MTLADRSETEQLALLESAARRALTQWGILEGSLQYIAYGSNAMFRMDTPNGLAFAVRVHGAGRKTLADVQHEATWLRDLSGRAVCVPMPTFDPLSFDDNDVTFVCSAFVWQAGEVIPAAGHTLDDVQRIGAYLARLHHASGMFTPPNGFQRPTLDYEGLFGSDSPYNPQGGAAFISEAAQQILDAVGERVQVVMAHLRNEPASFGMIHGDYIFKNTLLRADRSVCALDFNDCGWGFYLYDMACPLLFYRSRSDYGAVKAALWTGYTAVRPLTESHRDLLETLIAGRYAASCRWVAANAHLPVFAGKATAVIDERTEVLQGFLRSGIFS